MSFLGNKLGKHFIAILVLIVSSSPAGAVSGSHQDQTNMTSYLKSGNVVLQLGGFQGVQGRSQHIDIPGAIGDDFSVTNRHDQNILLGAGYYFTGPSQAKYDVQYGLNFFYLPQLSVKGNVTQEGLFTNLSYKYSISHLPVYVVLKGIFHTSSRYDVTLDGGVGPNFMLLQKFYEQPINPASVPDDPFTRTVSTRLAATLGLGIRLNHAFQAAAAECGYRFFYLGNGSFDHTVQVSSSLKTGYAYANAIICSVIF